MIDPQEMKNQFANPDYADEVARLKKELQRLRERYEVPENEKQDLTNVDRHYHSESIRARGIERRKAREAKEAQEKGR